MRRCAGARGEPGGDPAAGCEGSASAIVPNKSPLIAADGYFAACSNSLSKGPLSHANTAIVCKEQPEKAETMGTGRAMSLAHIYASKSAGNRKRLISIVVIASAL